MWWLTSLLSLVALSKDAPVYMEQKSKMPSKTGLEEIISHQVFCCPSSRPVTLDSPVISNVEHAETFCEALQILRRHPLQEVNVLVRVEAAHVMGWCAVRPIQLQITSFNWGLGKGDWGQRIPRYLHLFVEAIVQDQIVRDGHALRFHGMAWPCRNSNNFQWWLLNEFCGCKIGICNNDHFQQDQICQQCAWQIRIRDGPFQHSSTGIKTTGPYQPHWWRPNNHLAKSWHNVTQWLQQHPKSQFLLSAAC